MAGKKKEHGARVEVRLPLELERRAKVCAAHEGKTLGAFVRDAIAEHCDTAWRLAGADPKLAPRGKRK